MHRVARGSKLRLPHGGTWHAQAIQDGNMIVGLQLTIVLQICKVHMPA